MAVTRVLVVGAGIGGLASVIALKALGIDVLALEQAPDLAHVEVGAGITLWPNALLVLDRLGLGDEVRRRGTILHCFEQRTRGGRLISRWPLDDLADGIGAPVVGISRTTLHAILSEAAGDNVQAASKVTEIQERDGTVTAKIADGRVETGDVLIGADGIESMTRRHVVGDEAPRPVELTMWRANVALEENAMPPVDFEAFWGPGAKFVAFRSGPGQLSWEAIVASPPGGHDPPGESKRVVLERFAGFHKDEERIVGATPDGAVFRSDVFDRPPDPHWSSGRVALLGDAAHPMTFAVGQGAAQALEDALAIGDALADTTDVEAALRGYAERRAARAAHFQTLAYRLARLGGWQNPASWRFRNAMFKVMNPMGWRMQFKELPLPARPTP